MLDQSAVDRLRKEAIPPRSRLIGGEWRAAFEDGRWRSPTARRSASPARSGHPTPPPRTRRRAESAADFLRVNAYGGSDVAVPMAGMEQSGDGVDKSMHADLKTVWMKL